MDNITLIGMPGCGKSTIGVILAKVLGYRFVDIDLLIQQREKKLLHEIIKEHGVEKFLEIEEDVGKSVIGEQMVIATGGSIVFGKQAMEHFRKISTIVYIHLPLEELEKRLGNIRRRGVVFKEGQTLADIYRERTPLYESYAQITVKAAGMDTEELMDAIVEKLNHTGNGGI